MSNIQKEIENLEKVLELKKAYLAADISFKGAKFPKEIRDEVTLNLMQAAEQLATGTKPESTDGLSSEDIEIVKAFVSQLKVQASTKQVQSPAEPPMQSKPEVENKQPQENKQVNNQSTNLLQILTCENINPQKMRATVSIGDAFKPVGVEKNKYGIEMYRAVASNGDRFLIPVEDVVGGNS